MKRIFTTLPLIATFLLVACSPTPAAQTREISVEARELAFHPTRIEATVGEALNITLKNAGALEHDWTIQEIPITALKLSQHAHSDEGAEHAEGAQLHTAAQPGDSVSIGFTPTQAGTYEFFCSVPGHKDGGMKGELVVR